jgi:Domain of unknown function (DUF222)
MFDSVGLEELRAQEAAVKALCAALDPESIPLPDVPAAHACVVAMRKAIAGAETRLARRVDESRVWQRAGAADAAEYLARAGGTSTAAARSALDSSRKLRRCPEVEAAVAQGELSEPQAAAIADAASVNPGAAPELLRTAGEVSLGELRDECARAKAKASDPAESERRIHARRSLREYTDAEGAWCLHARGTIADGSKVSAVLRPIIDQLFQAARRDDRREPRDAYAFDALVEMAERAAQPDGGREGRPAAQRRPSLKHLSLVRVDAEALTRGATEGDEVCEIAGLGPISVPAARGLLGDSILKLVVTRGADVVNVTHLGRGLSAAQQIAQWWLQPACTNLGCPRRARLENDHRVPYAQCRETTLANNDPYCNHCHDLKTYEGWAPVEGRGRRPLVPPDDPRHPANVNALPAEPRPPHAHPPPRTDRHRASHGGARAMNDAEFEFNPS